MFEYGKRTYIMGILNVTPDSFSDGGDFTNVDIAVKHAKDMIEEGADIIDLGGESTRPGHKFVSADEEIKRIVPVIKKLKEEIKVPISIDTYKAEVAEEVLKLGVDMINDVWGLKYDENMAEVIGRYDAHVCIMHNQDGTDYDKDIMIAIKEFLQNSIEKALKAGVKKEKIVLDPGIGFAKTLNENLIIMNNLEKIKDLGYPVLLATSRKSMIGLTLDEPVDQRVEGTIATTVLGITKGCEFVRVHDIKENKRACVMTDAMLKSK